MSAQSKNGSLTLRRVFAGGGFGLPISATLLALCAPFAVTAAEADDQPMPAETEAASPAAEVPAEAGEMPPVADDEAMDEEGDDASPGADDGRSPAEQALDAYAQESELLLNGKGAAAEFHFNQGVGYLTRGNLIKAVEELRLAVDYEPDNELYRKKLEQARMLSGSSENPYQFGIDNTAAQVDVLHQSLMVDIQRQIEIGEAHLHKGEYNQAEFAFQRARTRLEVLPYADQRKPALLRQVEQLLAQTKQERVHQELAHEQNVRDQAAQIEGRKAAIRDKIERMRIEQRLSQALKALERRDYDKCILLCEQILRENRAEPRAHELLVKARRDRHVYLRQITADKWDEEHKLLSEEIRRSMLPMNDLVVYPDNWAEIDATRRAPTQAGEIEEEGWKKDIERKLEQKLTLNFPDLGIDEVVEFLQRNTSVNFVLDPQVSPADIPPINMKLEDVKLSNALQFIMLNTGLRYSLQGEAVYISNEEGLRGDIYMRVYGIRDLTLGLTQFPGPTIDIPEPGGTGAELVPEIADENAQEIDDFMEIIEQIIPADLWVDGTGIDEWNGSLVVTQTSDVHDQIEELLRTLRNQQAVQINVKVRFLTVENSLLEEIGFDWNNFRGPPGWQDFPPPAAGPNPNFGRVTPPWWLGGYWADDFNAPRNIFGAQLTNDLQDYAGDDSLGTDGGFNGSFQIYEDPEGFLARLALKAVEKDRRTNTLIAPNLTLMSGQRAHIVRMNQQAYIADFDVVGEQYDPIVTVLSYGTVLDVEAVASADRRFITMTLQPTNSEVTAWRRFGTDIEDFGGVNVINTDRDGNNLSAIGEDFPILVPELAFRQVQTSVTIPDGGSLLIAGMTESRSARAHTGIPVLSHIPFIGRLFSKNGRAETEMKDLIYVEGNIVLFDEIEANL